MNFLKIEDPISICDIGAAPSDEQILIDSLLENTKFLSNLNRAYREIYF